MTDGRIKTERTDNKGTTVTVDYSNVLSSNSLDYLSEQERADRQQH
jgi:hypothetical protein